MLSKFSVSNFKGFSADFVFNLQNSSHYEFNNKAIKNGVVNNVIIYGANGVGKSNLGFAIFDLVSHLTDKHFNEKEYLPHIYLNAESSSEIAVFKYEFRFGQDELKYIYKKKSLRELVFEELYINGKLIASIDKEKKSEAFIDIKGAEFLKRNINDSGLSLLKYIRSNASLEDNEENKIFDTLFDFVDKMLFFRSLNFNMYLGLQLGVKGIEKDIIERGNVQNLEDFLNKSGIECRLRIANEFDQKKIAFSFGNKLLSFYDIASTGTKSLILFYYWYQRVKSVSQVSFVFIDEFDAYYHYELSESIVEMLKDTGVQFILTTHNTSLLNNEILRPDCYFIMSKNAIKALPECTPKMLRQAHNLEKMYKGGVFHV